MGTVRRPGRGDQRDARASEIQATARLCQVALAARRYAYGVRTVTPEVLAAQQKIADTFHNPKLIPKPIVVRDAQPPSNLLAKE